MLAQHPYSTWTITEYYDEVKDRYRVRLHKNGVELTLSRARYRMAVHLGRELLKSEEVDHIDENRCNDALENLQILTPDANKRKRRGRTRVPVTCCVCSRVYLQYPSRLFENQIRKSPNCCSKSCASRNTRRNQLHGKTW